MIVALLAVAALALHPNSLSSTRIEVQGPRIDVTVRCQTESLLEVIDGLDANDDGVVEALELAESADAIIAYVTEHYRLFTGTDRDLAGGRRLQPVDAVVVPVEPGDLDGFRYPLGGADVVLRFDTGGDTTPSDVLVESRLFLETSPDHIDLLRIRWEDEDEAYFALDAHETRARWDPSGRGAFPVYLRLGIRHILDGWDHLAFIAALVLSARRLRQLLWIVTAFTVAHSITLGLTVLGLIDLSPHGRLVEALIALSIAYVAVGNLVHPDIRRSRWIEALLFGLVHGLGFAGFLGGSLVDEEALWTALLAFNLGVELGQVLVVVALVAVLRLLPRRRRTAPEFLAPPLVRIGGSIAVAALGLMWFAERV